MVLNRERGSALGRFYRLRDVQPQTGFQPFADFVHLVLGHFSQILMDAAFVDGLDLLQQNNRRAVQTMGASDVVMDRKIQSFIGMGSDRCDDDCGAVVVAGIILKYNDGACATLL